LEPDDVLAVLDRLRRQGVRAYVGGGWGVDALVGEQSRPHADLDVSFDAQHEERAIESLRRMGFGIVTDQRPVRLVMSDGAARTVDLHPVRFDHTGAGVQSGFGGAVFRYPPDGFTIGTIAGEEVPCFTAELQVRFHTGYEPTEKDRRDMRVLHDRLGVSLPAPYGPK
jgi:lincosamide nucleotidyltransferase A/C/D/E